VPVAGIDGIAHGIITVALYYWFTRSYFKVTHLLRLIPYFAWPVTVGPTHDSKLLCWTNEG